MSKNNATEKLAAARETIKRQQKIIRDLQRERTAAVDRAYREGSARTLATLRAGCADDVEVLYLQSLGARGRERPAEIEARISEFAVARGLKTRGVLWLVDRHGRPAVPTDSANK